jgi:hypothetical protein
MSGESDGINTPLPPSIEGGEEMSGCSGGTAINVTPNNVSGRVVKTFIHLSSPSILKSTSVPWLLPIQCVCIAFTRSGHSITLLKSSNSSAYLVILKNHCTKSFCRTSLSHRQHLPFSTCSFASTVWHSSHQFTQDVFRYTSPFS